MKTMKRTVTFLVLLAMLLSTCGIMASAFHLAVESEPVDIPISQAGGAVEPQRYERCEVCPNGKVNYTETTYTQWRTDYYEDCIHGDQRAKDKIQYRTATKSYSCNNCDYGYDKTTRETRRVCMAEG